MASLLDIPIVEMSWLQRAGQMNGTTKASARLDAGCGGGNEAAPAGAWEPTVAQLVALQHLGDDWDGQGARAPSRDLLAAAVALAYLLNERGVDAPSSVGPGPDGSVSFEWQRPDGTFCEVEVVRPFYAEVMLIEPGKPARHWTFPTE
jgi:hypothetical protein